MPAQPYSTGPAHLFVGRSGTTQGINSQGAATTTAGFSPLYIGTAERTPQILIRRGFVPVFNDISGPVVPLDLMYASQEGFVSYNLTRYNTENYLSIAGLPNQDQPGMNTPGDIGSLMLTEGLAYDIYVQFPYQQYSAYSQMEPGYHFLGGVMVGPDDMNQLGTNPKRLHLLYHCLPAFDGTNFTLFNNDMSAIQGISTI